jgi:transcriptional regulator with XRE-family HTH domain
MDERVGDEPFPFEGSGEPFPLEELVATAPESAREAFLERSAAVEAGNLVRTLRNKAGLTQKALARKIHTSQSHLSEIERGSGLQGPTFSFLRKVSHACDAYLHVDIVPSLHERMTYDERRAISEAVDVPTDSAIEAFNALRNRAVTTIGFITVMQILAQRDPFALHRYVQWLRSNPLG